MLPVVTENDSSATFDYDEINVCSKYLAKINCNY